MPRTLERYANTDRGFFYVQNIKMLKHLHAIANSITWILYFHNHLLKILLQNPFFSDFGAFFVSSTIVSLSWVCDSCVVSGSILSWFSSPSWSLWDSDKRSFKSSICLSLAFNCSVYLSVISHSLHVVFLFLPEERLKDHCY